jgi:hypothetical protein
MQAKRTYQVELTLQELRDLKDAATILADHVLTLQIRCFEARDWQTGLSIKKQVERYRVLEQKIAGLEGNAWRDELRDEHIRADVEEAERYSDYEGEGN